MLHWALPAKQQPVSVSWLMLAKTNPKPILTLIHGSHVAPDYTLTKQPFHLLKHLKLTVRRSATRRSDWTTSYLLTKSIKVKIDHPSTDSESNDCAAIFTSCNNKPTCSCWRHHGGGREAAVTSQKVHQCVDNYRSFSEELPMNKKFRVSYPRS